MKKIKFLLSTLMVLAISSSASLAGALQSFDTGLTIMKVRTAHSKKGQIIVGSSYEGIVMAMSLDGKKLWESKTGAGTTIHDLWCADITGDKVDEILAANANGHIYCFDIKGEKLWDFKPYQSQHLTPMYSVCVVKDKNKTPYVVCGNFNYTCYYLNNKGELVKELKSQNYSKLKPWGKVERPFNYQHNANFLRPLPQEDGSDLLVLHASNNHMQGNGQIYIMKPLEEKPIHIITNLQTNHPLGDLRVVKVDGNYELMYGTSTLTNNTFNIVKFKDKTYTSEKIIRIPINRKYWGTVSYRINHVFTLPKKSGGYNYALFASDQFTLYPQNAGTLCEKHYSTTYSFNDVWPMDEGKILIASSQDGGSGVYILDTWKNGWSKAYSSLEPVGKIAKIKDSFKEYSAQAEKYKKPSYQRDPVQVVGFEGRDLAILPSLKNEKALELLASPWCRGKLQEPSWREPLYTGNKYLKARDGRNKYTITAEESRQQYIPSFEDAPGTSFWGGHGNDPLFYEKKVLTDIIDYGWSNGKKKTILVWPEMNKHDSDFSFVLDNHIFPIAEHLRGKDGKIALRAKDVFFQGPIYTKVWERVASGEFADIFIATMEETTDKTQDMSLMSRMGFWMSGAVDGWGVRCSRDDPSFDRSRQVSSQKLANHFLRKSIFSFAMGAKYMHNGYMNAEHMSLYLRLLDKEALFVPKREEILSLSPIHISMAYPKEEFIDEAENNKWTIFYEREKYENNPALFSHMNGSWPGASLPKWDFSTFVSGVVDRRQNAIPPYPNGMVLITPIQHGALADKDAPRGKMVDKMHPYYKNIMKEYITDGVDFISADGKTHYKANEFYTQVKKDIEQAAKKLPVVATSIEGGQAGWVVAQVDPTHLRLTLVDGGWLNPQDTKVSVKFNGITVKKVTDILTKEEYKVSKNQTTEIDIPCGMFRFIDIELSNPLKTE